jgi:DNA replication protein DnaC
MSPDDSLGLLEKRIEPFVAGLYKRNRDADPDCAYCQGWGAVVVYSPEHPDGVHGPCICVKRAKERRKAEQLMALSGLTPIELAKWRFDTFFPERAVTTDHKRLAEIKAQLMEYAERPRGWLVLCGPFGCGKTHLAYAVAARRYELGRAVYVATVPDLLDMLRRGFNSKNPVDGFDARFEAIKEVELLVLDDMGAQSGTAWADEKAYQLVNYRYAKELATVITTNENLRSQDCKIDGRIRSRLLEGADTGGAGLSRVISIPAGDYRPFHVTQRLKA